LGRSARSRPGRLCNRAIQLNPELDQAYNNRANGYASLGLVTQAIDDYETAIDLNPFNVRARINLGVTRRELGDFDKALTCFDEALVFYQLTAVIYAERGRTFHLRGDWNCAIADYHRALNLINASEDKPQHYRLACRIRKWLAELLPSRLDRDLEPRQVRVKLTLSFGQTTSSV
jgi:tetratricopeptide (TPR) repeat protein